MPRNLLSINHNNLFAQIDSNIFGNRKLIIREIQSGFLETVKTKARNEAIGLLKNTWNLPERAKNKTYVEEVAKQIVKSFLADLVETGELTNLAQNEPETNQITCESRLRDTVEISSAALMFSSMEACMRKDLWEKDKDGIAFLQHRAKNNPHNYIEHYISSPGDISLLPWDEARQIIEQFGFTTAKLHLIFAAHAMNQDKPWENKFSIKASDIIKEFGWDRNHQKSKSKKLQEIASTAFALDCLLVKAIWVEGKNSQGKIIASAPVGRMWNIFIKPIGQLDLEGKMENPEEVYITVLPGLWTQDFLNRAGARSRQALYQFGYLAKEVLKIDPYHNELALRLAIYLTLHSRVRLDGNYKVRELLEMAFPVPEISSARTDYRKAYNLKQCWDSSLELLERLNWEIEFDEQSYPEYLRPESNQKQPKGYFDKLLDAKICIYPPDPIPELLSANIQSRTSRSQRSRSEDGIQSPPQKKLKPSSCIELTGELIRNARTAKGLSQEKLAGFLNVSQKLISLIERGERPINKKLEKKIRLLLEL
jgi:DNA-binding transcriptional regulator YiaG